MRSVRRHTRQRSVRWFQTWSTCEARTGLAKQRQDNQGNPPGKQQTRHAEHHVSHRGPHRHRLHASEELHPRQKWRPQDDHGVEWRVGKGIGSTWNVTDSDQRSRKHETGRTPRLDKVEPTRMAIVVASFPYQLQLEEFKEQLHLKIEQDVVNETVPDGEGSNQQAPHFFIPRAHSSSAAGWWTSKASHWGNGQPINLAGNRYRELLNANGMRFERPGIA